MDSMRFAPALCCVGSDAFPADPASVCMNALSGSACSDPACRAVFAGNFYFALRFLVATGPGLK